MKNRPTNVPLSGSVSSLDEQGLRTALRELPRERASVGFTAETLTRAEKAASRRPKAFQAGLAAAAAIAILLAVGTYTLWTPSTPGQISTGERAQGRRERLREQHLQLEQELASIRAQMDRAPQLHLSASDDLELVLDLKPWLEAQDIRQVSYVPSNF